MIEWLVERDVSISLIVAGDGTSLVSILLVCVYRRSRDRDAATDVCVEYGTDGGVCVIDGDRLSGICRNTIEVACDRVRGLEVLNVDRVDILCGSVTEATSSLEVAKTERTDAS